MQHTHTHTHIFHRQGRISTLKCFLKVWGVRKLGALHDKDQSEGSRTALHTAAYYGSSDAVHLLIHAGVDTNATDSTFSRTTPLMESARAGHAGKYIASSIQPRPQAASKRSCVPRSPPVHGRKNTCVLAIWYPTETKIDSRRFPVLAHSSHSHSHSRSPPAPLFRPTQAFAGR